MSEENKLEVTNSEVSLMSNNLTFTCRLCLTVNDKLFPLFRLDEIETSAIPLFMKISLCTSIRMSRQDILPQKICETCLNYVSEWYKFRKKCIRNDLYLKKCLSSTVENTLVTQDEGRGKICDLGFKANEIDTELDISVHPEDSAEASGIAGIEHGMDTTIKFGKTDESLMSGKPLMRTPTKKFKCSSCPDSFYYVEDLNLHRSVLHKAVKSEKIAKGGPAAAAKEDDLNLDEATVRSRYEMKCCEEVFSSKARFRKHFNKKHPGEKPYMCETCGKKDFISEETLKRHKILHTGKYKCEICAKTFTCNAILIIHKRDKHENDRPFICDVCGKRFVTELLMNYHKRFHTGEKKYVCEECGLAVVTSSSLAKHKRIHSDVKPHVCEVCGKGFIIKGRLVEHLRVHTGERPYSCHICHKAFTLRDKLKRHIRIHSGEKLFSCEYCGNNYSTSYGLTVHLKSHTVRNY